MKKTTLFIFVIFSLASLINFVSAHTGDDNYGHHSMMDWMMGGTYGYSFMWIFGWIFMILILVALILLIVWLIKQMQKR